jgi:hypothetical protein
MHDKSLEKIGKDWGNRRSSFFKEGDESGSSDDEDEDEFDQVEAAENAAHEAQEALLMKRQMLKNVSSADYDLGSSDEEDDKKSKKKKGKSAKKNKAASGASELEQQQLERVAAQAPELLSLLSDFKSNLATLESHIVPVLSKVKEGQLPTENGLSYLEAKYQAMLNYCLNIAFYLYLRAKGESVQNHPVIAELVRVRTLLEKLKPLDAKLKTQIDEIVASVSSSSHGKSAKAKPDINGLVADDDDEEEEEEGSEVSDEDEDEDEQAQSGGKGKAYKAPKHMLVSSTFDEDERADARQQKRQAQRVRKLKNNALLRELTAEFSDRPAEEPSIGASMADAKNRKLLAERTRYEEENFVRLQESKKEKAERIRREREAEYGMRNSLNELEDFGDLEGDRKSVV